MSLGRFASGAAAVGFVCAVWACATAAATQVVPLPADASAAAEGLPSSASGAREVFESQCNECHEYQYATGMRNSREGWSQVVGLMVSYGMEATDEQRALIIDYLTQTYGPAEP